MTSLGCAWGELLVRYFGSGATPDYSATLSIHARDPYRPLRERLSSIVNIGDSTDLNCDLGASWWFMRGAVAFNLRLSYVGPFALLIQHPGQLPDHDVVLDEVRAHGFVALPMHVVDESVQIWEPESVGSLYEFLFEFDNGTPWSQG